MPAMDNNSVDEDKIDNMMTDLLAAFTWDKSPQGQLYWEGVFNNLDNMRQYKHKQEKVNGG